MKTGTSITFTAVSINLIVALLLMIFMVGDFNSLVDFLSQMWLNIAVGLTGLYIAGYFIGLKMENLIILKKWNSIITGIIGLLFILVIGIVFGSTVGFIQEGSAQFSIEGGIKDAVIDYYFKPLYWTLLFGFIPTIIMGGIMGALIKERATSQR